MNEQLDQTRSVLTSEREEYYEALVKQYQLERDQARDSLAELKTTLQREFQSREEAKIRGLFIEVSDQHLEQSPIVFRTGDYTEFT